MKVVYHEDYNEVYSNDPASAPGRIQAVEKALRGKVTFIEPVAAIQEDILKVHTPNHVRSVEREGVYDIAALAAGGAMKAERMRRPSAVRTGMFCRLGSTEDSRPVTATA